MRVLRVLLFLPLLAGIPCSAQSDTELLQGLLCEIRELRSAFLQGQATAPLLDANRREREFAARRLDTAIERQRETQERLQSMNERMNELVERLRDVLRNARVNITAEEREQMERQLRNERRKLTEAIPQVQNDVGRATSEASGLRTRIAELESEYERLQAQMRSLAANSGSVCEASVR